jgi:hypothetical protein
MVYDIYQLLDEVEDYELDDLVHQTKSEEATGINNCGKEEQLSYLLESGWTIKSIKEVLS